MTLKLNPCTLFFAIEHFLASDFNSKLCSSGDAKFTDRNPNLPQCTQGRCCLRNLCASPLCSRRPRSWGLSFAPRFFFNSIRTFSDPFSVSLLDRLMNNMIFGHFLVAYMDHTSAVVLNVILLFGLDFVFLRVVSFFLFLIIPFCPCVMCL